MYHYLYFCNNYWMLSEVYESPSSLKEVILAMSLSQTIQCIPYLSTPGVQVNSCFDYQESAYLYNYYAW